MVMGRGERVARGYIGAVLAVQALVYAVLDDRVKAGCLVLQLVAAALLWLPLVFDFRHRVLVRSATAAPAVLLSAWWATQSATAGAVAWGAWALAVVWLTFPADRQGLDTLAERFAPRRAQTGAHR